MITATKGNVFIFSKEKPKTALEIIKILERLEQNLNKFQKTLEYV